MGRDEGSEDHSAEAWERGRVILIIGLMMILGLGFLMFYAIYLNEKSSN
jgi:hypothetical protein